MRVICCIALFVAAAMANCIKPHYDLNDAPALFEKFIKDYNRHYKDEADKLAHYEAFVRSLETINKANAHQCSATYDINSLADYTPEELQHLNGFWGTVKV